MTELSSLTDPVWMTTKEAAAYARMPHDSLRRLIAAGTGPETSQAVPAGHHRIHREWMDQWLITRGTRSNRGRHERSA